MTTMHTDTLPEPNRDDRTDCPRCDTLDEECLYHQGEADGTFHVLRGVRIAATLFDRDPEALGGLLHTYQRHCRRGTECPAVLHRRDCPTGTHTDH